MSDWLRSTRKCTPSSLPAEVTTAIRAHQERYNLGDLLSKATLGIETISRTTKKGLLGGRTEEVRITALLTPQWLVRAIAADRAEPTIMSARLQAVVARDYASTKFAEMVPDSGLEISGAFTDVSARGAAFIGLGPEPASEEFKTAINEAV